MVSHAGATLHALTAPSLVHEAPAWLPTAASVGAPSEPKNDARALVRRLFDLKNVQATDLTFYAALRRLECRFRRFPRLGEAAGPADEPVRLAQDPSLEFRAAAFASVVDGQGARPPRISVGFFGAFGPHGPLPLHLTEYAYERKRHHADGGLIGFFDIFHHRLLSLLYRAWASSQPTVSHDRPEEDHFARHLGALIGVTSAIGNEPFSQLDYACLHAAPHFVGRTRHPEGLAKTLRAYLRVPARVEEFVGRWLQIPDDSCWRVPTSAATQTESTIGVLGQSTLLGRELWEQQSSFTIVLGPLGRKDYQRLLPGMPDLRLLAELVERYAGLDLAWNLRLVLREPERRSAVLGVEGRVGLTAHLAGGDGAVSLTFEDLFIESDQMFLPTHYR